MMIVKKSQVLAYRLMTIVSLCFATFVHGKGANTELSKTVLKHFSVERGVTLDISNKYGDIILNTWDQDSISIEAVATAYGKNNDIRERSLDRTEFIFEQRGDVVSAKTVFDQSKGFLRDFISSLNDYSRVLLSREQLNISYTIFAPEYTRLEIINKFGDIVIDEFKNTIRVDLANGNMKTGDVYDDFRLSLHYGNGIISSADNVTLDLKSAELDLINANRIDLLSSTSTVNIKEVKKLQINSRADKIRISDLYSIEGKSSFSKLHVYRLHEGSKLRMSYGNFTVDWLKKGFTLVDIIAQSTDFNLTYDPGSYVKTTIQTKVGKLQLPESSELKQVYTDGREKFIHSSGYLGYKKGILSEILIDAQGGNMIIRKKAKDIDNL